MPRRWASWAGLGELAERERLGAFQERRRAGGVAGREAGVGEHVERVEVGRDHLLGHLGLDAVEQLAREVGAALAGDLLGAGGEDGPVVVRHLARVLVVVDRRVVEVGELEGGEALGRDRRHHAPARRVGADGHDAAREALVLHVLAQAQLGLAGDGGGEVDRALPAVARVLEQHVQHELVGGGEQAELGIERVRPAVELPAYGRDAGGVAERGGRLRVEQGRVGGNLVDAVAGSAGRRAGRWPRPGT